MAVGDIFGSLKNTVKTAYNNFFYSGRQAPPVQGGQQPYQDTQNQQYTQTAGSYQQQYQSAGAYQQSYQQTGTQQQPYQQTGTYQQPYQQTGTQQQPYQQPYQQAGQYQQAPAQQGMGGNQAPVFQQSQQQPQNRARRIQFRTGKRGENTQDQGGYQQNMEQQNAPFAEQPAQEAAQQTASLLSARVINARSMGDCRSAITLLRNGDAVVIVMENIPDPSEMRRLVDTLSGACYSLTATITKVSRAGVYLLAPQTMAVFADQATNMMNSSSARPQSRNYQPGYGQRVSYAPPQQQAQSYRTQPLQQPYGGPQGFSQRTADPEEAQQSFYQRPAPQEAQAPSFAPQPVGYGYVPDEGPNTEQ